MPPRPDRDIRDLLEDDAMKVARNEVEFRRGARAVQHGNEPAAADPAIEGLTATRYMRRSRPAIMLTMVQRSGLTTGIGGVSRMARTARSKRQQLKRNL